MPTDKPIQRGAPVISPEGDQVWVAFQYERLQGLCFHYGLLGHEAKSCIVRLRDGEETPYGEWLCVGFRRPKFQQTRAPPTPPRRDQGDKVQGSTTYKSCD
uniref:Zinc knuckle CX2CX4HX4C domain-containing protein n=1 Tax=Quercus lobata TaxID=97700 RepID=A0A7N2LK31_QUELO